MAANRPRELTVQLGDWGAEARDHAPPAGDDAVAAAGVQTGSPSRDESRLLTVPGAVVGPEGIEPSTERL